MESKRLLRLCEKDNYTCHICGEKVLIGMPEGHPSRPTRDHIISRQKMRYMYDKNDVKDNLRLAHSFCNSRRGSYPDSMIDRELALNLYQKALSEWEAR